MKVVLYTTACPKCKILKSKLDDKGIEYEACNDVETMVNLGMTTVPVLVVDDGEPMNYSQSIKWVSEQ